VTEERGFEVKGRALDGFGKRLAAIRRAQGLTQDELGKLVAVSKRVIAYYEQEDAQPPGAMLVDLARALRISADELLGLKPAREKSSPKTARLLKRLQKIEKLPPSDQRAILKFVDALTKSRTQGSNGATAREARS
jgi:transcriptional regulator with XRE-family HTH domain